MSTRSAAMFGPLSLTLAAALLLATIVGFALVPAGTILPIHWGITGEPDNFAPREIALLLPVGLAALVWTIMAVVRRTTSDQQFEPGRHAVRAVIVALTALALAIEVTTILLGLGHDISMVQVVALGIAVLLILLGNIMPKSQPNGFAGIRLRSTLGDARNWQATHRVVGLAYLGAGLLLGVVALMPVPPTLLFVMLIAAVGVPLIGGILYSLRFARRARG